MKMGQNTTTFFPDTKNMHKNVNINTSLMQNLLKINSIGFIALV